MNVRLFFLPRRTVIFIAEAGLGAGAGAEAAAGAAAMLDPELDRALKQKYDLEQGLAWRMEQ